MCYFKSYFLSLFDLRLTGRNDWEFNSRDNETEGTHHLAGEAVAVRRLRRPAIARNVLKIL